MSTVTVDPNGDVDVNWYQIEAGDHYQYVDDGIRQPTTAGFDGYIEWAREVEQGNVDEFAMEDGDIESGSASQIVVWTYGRYYDADKFTVTIYNGSGYESSQDVEVPNGSYGWTSNTFGSLSMDQTDINNLKVKYTAGASITKFTGYNQIEEFYAVVTYTAGSSGYGNTFLGVSPENIGNISGVDTANIDNVKGV